MTWAVVTDADDARWLRACVRPDQRERTAQLEAAIALAASARALLLQGDAAEVVPDAIDRSALRAQALGRLLVAGPLAGVAGRLLARDGHPPHHHHPGRAG